MRTLRFLAALGLITGWSVYVVQSDGKVEVAVSETKNQIVAEVPDDLAEYFPTDLGRRFVYNVRIFTSNAPLVHSVTMWPERNGESVVRSESRNRLLVEEGEGLLVLKVGGVATKQGPLEGHNGYKIRIERDDLGIYEHSIGLFWVISDSGRYQVSEITLHDLNSPIAPEFDVLPGYATRISFFVEKPGTILLPEGENDSIAFFGQTMLDGLPCLHFVRMVEPDSGTTYVQRGFVEEYWFVRGKGLVRLEQKVGGKTTMLWTLDGVFF